jgi:hypothetical protein
MVVVWWVVLSDDSLSMRNKGCKLKVVLMGKDRDSESEFRNGALRDGREI